MKQAIQTIVITEQLHTAELLKRYVDESENFTFLAETSDFSKAYSAIKELAKVLVIVDVSEYQEQALNFVSKITSEFNNCRVFALSDRPVVDLVIRAMRIGASDFLSLPLIKDEFFEEEDTKKADMEPEDEFLDDDYVDDDDLYDYERLDHTSAVS